MFLKAVTEFILKTKVEHLKFKRFYHLKNNLQKVSNNSYPTNYMQSE